MQRKYLITFLLLINSVIALAQQPIYFSNIYNPVNTYASGRGILQNGNFYYGIFGTLESTGYWYNIGVIKMDMTGEILNWNLIGENGYDYFAGSVGGTLIKTMDGHLAFTCHIGAPGPTQGTLVKLDLSLNTIWEKYYLIEEQYTMPIKVKQMADGGYVMVGQVYPGTGYYYDALIINTDNLGNELWNNTFGVNSNASEYGTDVIQTPDGGYLIGGMKDIESIDHSLDAMLIKTDSLGNKEWTQYYGHPEVDDDMALVAMADDGNYLVATVYGGTIFAPESRSGRICILKVDNEGNTIYETKLGPNRLNFHIKNLRKIYDGYMLSGFSKETDTTTYQYFSGWMMKLDDNLDSIWYRDYLYEDENWENYFYDAYPTSDNGYIAIGKARPDLGGTNKMWIVKVDSLGCDTPGCATGVSVVEFPETKTGNLLVWPNPTSEQITLSTEFFEISKYKTGKDSKIIRIFNSQGLKVDEITVPNNTESLQIDVSAYPVGLYYLQYIYSNQIIETVKFIKN